MDLNLSGRTALVCASSKGLGKACALSLAREGANVVMNGRNQDSLDAAMAEVRAVAAGRVEGVACDITTEAGQGAALAAAPYYDILVNNAGGPPPGDFRDWGREQWLDALNANMLTAITLITATVDGMIERGFGRIVNITSVAVKAPIAVLGLSNGARCGLTGFVAGVARQVAGQKVTINNILPGRFDTNRLRGGIRYAAEQSGRSFDEVFAQDESVIPAGRFGDPAEFGELCAYLCSTQAAYITGQNLLIDGGAYPGTF